MDTPQAQAEFNRLFQPYSAAPGRRPPGHQLDQVGRVVGFPDRTRAFHVWVFENIVRQVVLEANSCAAQNERAYTGVSRWHVEFYTEQWDPSGLRFQMRFSIVLQGHTPPVTYNALGNRNGHRAEVRVSQIGGPSTLIRGLERTSPGTTTIATQ